MQSQTGRHSFSEMPLANDNELFQQVVARLQRRFGNQVRHFQMSARVDGLVLRGVVKTYYGKQMVQEVVMEMTGRVILANDIEVQRRAATQRVMAAAQ